MTIQSIGRESAKIYLFPVSPRLAHSRFEQEVARLAGNDAKTLRPIMAESGWYHDEAMSSDGKLT